jgi:hypothetical protein
MEGADGALLVAAEYCLRRAGGGQESVLAMAVGWALLRNEGGMLHVAVDV